MDHKWKSLYKCTVVERRFDDKDERKQLVHIFEYIEIYSYNSFLKVYLCVCNVMNNHA